MPKVLNRHHGIPKGAVYIGRPTKWGNMYKAGVDGNRDECIKKFEEFVRHNKWFRNMARKELAGKDLACSCKPLSCHGDILLEVANSPFEP